MPVVKPTRALSQINVTPLVDVVLVLLIIFMVVTPMLQKGVEVKLPKAKNAEKQSDNRKPLVVAIRSDGSIFVEQERTEKDQFVSEMIQIVRTNPFMPILVKGDADLTYGDVKEVMEMLNQAGAKEVGLAAENVSPDKKGELP